jgi:FkbM family methyltransferase
MVRSTSPRSSDGLVIYGLGTFGQQIVDDLLAEDVKVDLILDRGKRGQQYRGIAILGLEDAADGQLTGRSVLIGLHNHYVDINRLYGELRAAGATRILTPINLPQLIPQARTRPGYWLDADFDYAKHEANFARVRQLLADDKSRQLLDAILRYRRSGDVTDCPIPSLDDEYTPKDLPRFAGPLRLVDCGAFTGVAIHKFLKAGYQIESFVAFEPDPVNFATLAARNLPVTRGLCLPLGTWSTTKQLSFASDGSMGSRLSETGAVTVQCVAIDEVLHGEEVNLVKLDVEGAEIETLKGMELLIRSQRPNLLVSVYHTPGHLHEIAELIESWGLGYSLHLRVHEYNTFGVVLYCLRRELLETQS